jgi:hypothetical protein
LFGFASRVVRKDFAKESSVILGSQGWAREKRWNGWWSCVVVRAEGVKLEIIDCRFSDTLCSFTQHPMFTWNFYTTGGKIR